MNTTLYKKLGGSFVEAEAYEILEEAVRIQSDPTVGHAARQFMEAATLLFKGNSYQENYIRGRVMNALERGKVTLAEAKKMEDDELLLLEGIGPKGVQWIRRNI